MKKSTRTLIAAPLAVVLVLLGTAGAYAGHYRDLALPGSEVSGVSVSGKTRAEVTALLEKRVAQTEITVTAGTTSKKASLADLGYRVDIPATVEKVFGVNEQWSNYARALVSPISTAAVVSVDQKVVDASIVTLVAEAGQVAVDAKVSLAEGASEFTVTPDAPGTTVEPSSFQAVVRKAAESLTSTTATVHFVTGEATITTAKAQDAADAANKIVATPVTIAVGTKTVEATAPEKATWVRVPVADGALGQPTVDVAAVTAWVQAKADAAKVGAVTGQRTLSAATGETLRVTTEAKDGSEVTNATQVAQAVAAGLTSKTAYAGTFETKAIPATWTERRVAVGAENLAYPAAEGEKWVDVNLSAHTMTAYEGGRAVIGPVAMVNGAAATPTITGTFKIYTKYASQTMRGQNADGTDYEAPDVPWVSYFSGGYALHGAPWRDSFGYTGSHGCVNLPVSTAKQVFDWAPIGTVVVSHH